MENLNRILESVIDSIGLWESGAITFVLDSRDPRKVRFAAQGSMFYFYNVNSPLVARRKDQGDRVSFTINGSTGEMDNGFAIQRVVPNLKARAAGWEKMRNPDYVACSRMIVRLNIHRLSTTRGQGELATFLHTTFTGGGNLVAVRNYDAE